MLVLLHKSVMPVGCGDGQHGPGGWVGGRTLVLPVGGFYCNVAIMT